MIDEVRTYIHAHRLLEESRTPVVVGLSGGGDSVGLLAVLVKLGYSCIAAHCNFRLRGEESERDAVFAERFAKEIGVPFRKRAFDTSAYAQENKLSIEAAARELRYRWFEELRNETRGQAIAVAHHRDDNAETLLLNLIRGSGIRGLCGMHPRNGQVVRPLLALSRQAILTWVEEQGLAYVTDSTNFSDVYRRNFLRLHIFPFLEKINPSVQGSLARSAEHLSDALLLYDYALSAAKKEVLETVPPHSTRLSIAALLRFPAAETVLYELLKPYGFTPVVCQEIFRALPHTSGKTFFSADWRLVKDRDSLLVSPREFCVEKPLLFYRILPALPPDFPITVDKRTAWFDCDRLSFPLILRRWRQGDRFIPFGMKGRKKLSDYFSDHKLSLLQKEQAFVLCSGEDILWIVGERADNRFRIDDTTNRILLISIYPLAGFEPYPDYFIPSPRGEETELGKER